MANHTVSMLVGAAIDRNEGRSGIGGAIKGTMIDGVDKLVPPPAVTLAVGWAVHYVVGHGLHAGSGNDDFRRS